MAECQSRCKTLNINIKEGSPVNSNTPVIIGVSQILQRVADLNDAKEPIDLMVQAALKAALLSE